MMMMMMMMMMNVGRPTRFPPASANAEMEKPFSAELLISTVRMTAALRTANEAMMWKLYDYDARTLCSGAVDDTV